MHLKRCTTTSTRVATLPCCRVEACGWCTGVRASAAEYVVVPRSLYSVHHPAPSPASKAGSARGEGAPKTPKARYEGLSQVLPVQPLREQVYPNKCCRGKFLIVQHFCQHLNSISPGDITRRSVRRIPKCSGQSLREVWQHWRRSRGTTCRPTRDQRRAPAWSA